MSRPILSNVLNKSLEKFANPDWTAKGEPRATVSLKRLEMLWINTGTLCNITCQNCYIESSPTNDRLSYIKAEEVKPIFEEAHGFGVQEIGFTGGEPFLNPELEQIVSMSLRLGFKNLILTNAMTPMQRPQVQEWLLKLNLKFSENLKLRISLDHFKQELHDQERGEGSYAKTLLGITWLLENGFRISIAGRSFGEQSAEDLRDGYRNLFKVNGWPLDPDKSSDLTIFPEMNSSMDVPEITPNCWQILNKSPESLMCATSRMVVKRKGAKGCVVLPCTLLPYNEAFEMGATLSEASRADGGMFTKGAVKLAHPHCSKFCVLGGGSCSA